MANLQELLAQKKAGGKAPIKTQPALGAPNKNKTSTEDLIKQICETTLGDTGAMETPETPGTVYKTKIEKLTEALFEFEKDKDNTAICSNLQNAMIDARNYLRSEPTAAQLLLPTDVRLIVSASRSYFENLSRLETKKAAPKTKKQAAAKKPRAKKTAKPGVLDLQIDFGKLF